MLISLGSGRFQCKPNQSNLAFIHRLGYISRNRKVLHSYRGDDQLRKSHGRCGLHKHNTRVGVKRVGGGVRYDAVMCRYLTFPCNCHCARVLPLGLLFCSAWVLHICSLNRQGFGRSSANRTSRHERQILADERETSGRLGLRKFAYYQPRDFSVHLQFLPGRGGGGGPETKCFPTVPVEINL